ncbi:MAG TPA: Hsp20/alpha crystallin family protein [Gemmataceae bacterium]
MADTELKKAPEGGARLAPSESPERVTVTPRVDIVEKEDELLLLADMPGVRPDDVDVRYENGELTLLGRRPAPPAAGRRAFGNYDVANYYRAFRIGENIAADQISAELKDGVLTLHLPKVEAVRPRKITVKGG